MKLEKLRNRITFKTVILAFIAINLIAALVFLFKLVPAVGGFIKVIDSWTYRLLRSDIALFLDLAILAAAIFWLLTSRK